jgi:hypothetical protein
MSNTDSFGVDSSLPNGSSSSASKWFLGPEKKSSLSSVDWNKAREITQFDGIVGSSADILDSLLEGPCELNGFSSSLPALLNEKCEWLNNP